MSMIVVVGFILVRLGIVIVGLAIAYLFISRIVNPYILKPACLTETNSCAYMVIYKLKNSFFAQVFPSGIYLWLNGSRLYVYGQAPNGAQCTNNSNYEVADRIDISGTNQSPIFTRQNYSCITKSSAIEAYYGKRTSPQTIYLRGISPTQTANLNVFELVTRLIDMGYISVPNLGGQSL
jgi:hypothetical protein